MKGPIDINTLKGLKIELNEKLTDKMKVHYNYGTPVKVEVPLEVYETLKKEYME